MKKLSNLAYSRNNFSENDILKIEKTKQVLKQLYLVLHGKDKKVQKLSLLLQLFELRDSLLFFQHLLLQGGDFLRKCDLLLLGGQEKLLDLFLLDFQLVECLLVLQLSPVPLCLNS